GGGVGPGGAGRPRRKLLAHGAAPAGRSGLTWGGLARGSLPRGGVGAPAMPPRGILLPRVVAGLAPARRLTRIGRGRRRQVAVEARLLLVVERAVEGRERGLDRVEGRERGVDPLLHRLEPRRRRRGHVLRAVGGEALGRLLGALTQRRERGALLLVGADALPDGVERPALDLGAPRGTAADGPLDHGAERAAASAQRSIAAVSVAPPSPILALATASPILVAGTPLFIVGAPPVVVAGPPAVVGLAGTIFAAIASQSPPAIFGVAAAPPLLH